MRSEQVNPEEWYASLAGRRHLQGAFDFNAYEDAEAAKLNWYEYSGSWSNRLIHTASVARWRRGSNTSTWPGRSR